MAVGVTGLTTLTVAVRVAQVTRCGHVNVTALNQPMVADIAPANSPRRGNALTELAQVHELYCHGAALSRSPIARLLNNRGVLKLVIRSYEYCSDCSAWF